MHYLHLASKKNINSILKYGIVPSYIQHDHHWELFNEYGLTERKCVYTWNAETYNNTKFIKDMVYTKFFIHPRNKLYNTVDHEIDFRQYGSKLFPEDETMFFLININFIEDNIGEWQHVQEPHDDRYGTTVNMSDKYSHADKLVNISKHTIEPKHIQIVEQINTRVYKTNQIGFSFRKF